MATITLGGLPCASPIPLARFCQEHGLPTDSWLGRANGFKLTLGRNAGIGYVLMSGGAFAQLSLNSPQTLVFSIAGSELAPPGQPTYTVTLKNLSIVRSESVTPGLRGDPNEHRLIVLADRRWNYYAQNAESELYPRVLGAEIADRKHAFYVLPIDTAFNVRSVPTGTYYAATTNSGTPWTWAQIGSQLWSAVGTSRLGAWPGLPFSPQGTPEDFEFWQTSAWDALSWFLDRVGCALRYNPAADTFGIVQLGAVDAVYTAALAARDGVRIWDQNDVQAIRGRIPEQVRIRFRALPGTPGTSPWYTVDLPDPTPYAVTSGYEVGSRVIVDDDMAALYNSAGTLQNAAALASRAADRAEDFYRRMWQSEPWLRRTYGLPLADQGLLPGARLKSTWWGDVGGGLITMIERHDDMPLQTWPAEENESLSTYDAQFVNTTTTGTAEYTSTSTLQMDAGSTFANNSTETVGGAVTYSSTYVGVYQSGSSTTWQSGSTSTWSSGSTLVMAGPTWNMTSSTTLTISTGQTWTIAGPGSLVVSAPMTFSASTLTVTGYLQTGYQTLTYSTQQNNITLTANTLILQPSAGSLNVTGFGKPATGTSPTVTIINNSPYPAPITNNDASSTSGNRTTCPGAATYYLQAADRVQITYDPVGSCWRLGDGTLPSSTAVGQVPIGNSTGGYTNATLTAGSGITITDSSGAVTIAASGGGGSPAGSNTQIQFNNSGAFGASANLTWDGTNLSATGNVVASGNGVISGHIELGDAVKVVGITAMTGLVGVVTVYNATGTLIGYAPLYLAYTSSG